MTATYTTGIPTPTQSLGVTNKPIRDNFTVLNDTISRNHVAMSFTDGSAGKHKFLQMPRQAAIPAGLVSGDANVYAKLANSVSQLFFSPDNSGNEYQLTRTLSTFFTLFSTLTQNYTPESGGGGVGAAFFGGWTFLPGGMLLQYGYTTTVANNTTIKYPINFSTFAIPVITQMRSDTNDKVVSIKNASNSNTQFQLITSGSTNADVVFWIAVGK